MYGTPRTAQAYQTEQHRDIDESVGRLIATWQTDGTMAKGAPTVEFNKAVTEARNEAEKAVAEDRASKRYQKAIRDYFDGLAPATPPADTPKPTGL